jgi:hypothetical protein
MASIVVIGFPAGSDRNAIPWDFNQRRIAAGCFSPVWRRKALKVTITPTPKKRENKPIKESVHPLLALAPP